MRDIGVTQAMYARVFLVVAVPGRGAGDRAGLRARWPVRDPRRRSTVGTVVALTAYLSRLYGPLTSLSNVQVDVMTALVSFDRVFEVLDLDPVDRRRAGRDRPARSSPAARSAVEFDHVDFRYPTAAEVSLASLESVAVLDNAPERQVLFDVSFRAEPGQLVALVGPSGAGKTTISQLVTRMYDVQSGAVRVGGHDVRERDADVAARRRRRGHPGRPHVPRHDPGRT